MFGSPGDNLSNMQQAAINRRASGIGDQQAQGESKMKEQWRVVTGFEDYEVSDHGRVRRLTAKERTYAGRLLKSWKNTLGYLQVTLMKDRKRYTKHVHQLVAIAFIPNPLGLPEVNHKGKLSDCRATKLEWRTHLGNLQYMAIHSEKQRGVTFCPWKKVNPWRARYNPASGKGKHIGFFPTKREAIKARRRAVHNIVEVL